jgi:hypothetical protein
MWEPGNDAIVPLRPARPARPWLGVVAAVVFAAAAVVSWQPWVSGEAPEVDGTVGQVLDLAGFEDGETISYKGTEIPGLGAGAAGLAMAGVALAVAGVVLRRPIVFLAASGAAGAVAALAGSAVVLLAWLEIDALPFSSSIPEDVRRQIPDPEVERGLWLYFLMAALGAVVCAVAAVTSHRRRYGVGPPAPPPVPVLPR